MKKVSLLEKTAIEPNSLIGTKWNAWSESIGNQMMIEFVDKTNCIYTTGAKKFQMTYFIIEGKILISNVEGAFELRGNVLFKGGLPAFEKTA